MTSSPTAASTAPVASIPLRLVLVLGLLTATGPLAIDMYLPALPSMGPALNAGHDALQASLMSFYLAMGAGQLVAGPLSDAFGRRTPLLWGLALFIAAGIGCAFASDVQTLVALRALQGLGACAAMVTPRAVVRDLATGAEAARAGGLLATIYSVSPIFAPLIGSVVAHAFGWRGVFVALAAVGAAALAMVALGLPETRRPEARTRVHPRAVAATYGRLLRDPHFLIPALMASLTLSGFFVYVAGSSFVFMGHYGVSPQTYALLFSLNVVPYLALAQAGHGLIRRFGLKSVLRGAAALQAASAFVLWAAFAAGVDNLVVLQLGLMWGFSFAGLLIPALFVTALDRHGPVAGSASALIGTLNFAGGALAMAAVAPFSDGRPTPMLAGTLVCVAAVLVLSRFVLRDSR